MVSQVLTKTRNMLKSAKNTPKKFKNWRNLEFSTSFRFLNFEPRYPKLGIFGKEVSTF